MKRIIRRPCLRWNDGIEMVLREIDVDWTKLAQDWSQCYVVSNVMNIRVP